MIPDAHLRQCLASMMEGLFSEVVNSFSCNDEIIE